MTGALEEHHVASFLAAFVQPLALNRHPAAGDSGCHTAPGLREPVPSPFRVVMVWLISLALVAMDGVIAGMALQLAGEHQGAVGSAIAQAADPGPDVIGVLQRKP